VAINLVSKVPGIGPVAARMFVDKLGVCTIDDLRKHADKLTTDFQRIGLQYFEDFQLRIPRAEVAAIEAAIKAEAVDIDPRLRCEAVGSYRRGLPSSGDVDVLITHPDFTIAKKESKQPVPWLSLLVTRLIDKNLIVATMSHGPMLFNGACRLVRFSFFLSSL